ncbi:hypothetical protein GON01_12205 [Sphingomonas sp. MAH-20]|jgi:hypothetical protein|uniref:UrcA family protein n=1 Tax=Sphingomonas horti TaxID=2682842 RepID=A0A6I4J6T5_9SPHN|nr:MULTISPECIES: hypothetical protein [Sphingomonas]MBA2918660.1 hypothetical protein [Sphingomonas sp. CGMCC 1.13658]MVO78691.1 hypothetical protein [Sphingomonas horti]
MKSLAAAALLAALLLPAPAAAQYDYDRALQNYRDLQAGRKQPQELTPLELEEIRRLDAAVRAGADLGPIQLPDTEARCRERNATAHPTPLEEAVLSLKCSQRKN